MEYGIAVKFLLVESYGLARFWKTRCSGSGSKPASQIHSRPPQLSSKGFAFLAECCLRRLRIAWLMPNLNADRERKKEKRRRKEKRKHQDNTSLTEEVKQPMEFDFQHDSSENFQIIERRKAIVLHPDGHHDHVNCARSFCACWVSSLHHSDIDVGLLPCLIELEKCIHQVLSSKQIDIIQKEQLGSRPFCEFHYPNGKAEVISDGSCVQIESQFRELILKWVPPPLETLNTEFSDQQWLYDREPLLRIDINKKTSAARSDHLCYPYTTLF